MRGPRKNLVKYSRRRRRTALALIMLASSPTLADDPDVNPIQTLPPLPLISTAESGSAQSNPFCEPFVNLESLKVRLTSGGHSSSIKLKPIGAAIGLQPINDADPNRIQLPRMTIEPVPTASIQTNPMAGSMHHANDDLVDAEVDDRAIIVRPKPMTPSHEAAAKPTRRKSSIVLMPAAPTQSAAIAQPTPPIRPEINAEPVVSTPLLLNTAIPSPVKPAAKLVPAGQIQPIVAAQTTESQQPPEQEAPPVAAVDTTHKEQETSISFSLSDRDDSSTEPQGDAAKEAIQKAEASPAPLKNTVQTELTAENAQAAESVPPNTDAEVGASNTPISIGVIEPIVIRDHAADKDLKPLDTVINDNVGAPIAIYRSEKAAVSLVRPKEESLQTKRYRPPVEVKPVPIAVVRDATAQPHTTIGSTVQQVEEPNLNGFGRSLGSGRLTPLYMTRAQVRSLTLGGEVRRVKVVNESVCQAFAAGPNKLKLIGTGNGVTQLVVWADSDDADAPTRMRSFEVHVKDAAESNGIAVAEKTRLLNQSIRRAFPTANVVVRRDGDHLIVAGNCESEATAKMIIRVVRKTCLVPVKDELVVR